MPTHIRNNSSICSQSNNFYYIKLPVTIMYIQANINVLVTNFIRFIKDKTSINT